MIFLERRKLRFSPITDYPKVSFVIPAYNAEKIIAESIKSIFRSNYPKSKIEVIAVNDGSTDRTLDILKNLSKKYPIKVYSKKNQGRKVFALNYGLRKARTPYVVALDADTVLSKNLLKKSIEHFSDPKVAAVICRIIPKNRKNLLERMQLIEYAFTSYHREILHAADSLQTTPAFTVFRKSFLDSYGLFDESNIAEDFEMGLKVQKHHYDIAYVSDEYVITDIPDNFRALSRQRVRWGYGVFNNLSKYHRLFNLKYGDFGIFFLPSMLFAIFALLGTIFLAVYSISSSFIDFIQKLMLGWRPVLFEFNLFNIVLSISELRAILAVLMFVLAFSIFIIIRKSDKRISFIDYIAYIFIYSWLLAYFYILSLARFVLNIKPKW
jgi:cellulose synthase/poly-beta-1,6-N-acetylglucosamine synthase-like glycosyltransferase